MYFKAKLTASRLPPFGGILLAGKSFAFRGLGNYFQLLLDESIGGW